MSKLIDEIYWYVWLSVNGSWGPWSQWSICSRTCDIGQRRRIRECDSPSPSNGGLHCNYSGDSAVDVVNCKMDDCPNVQPSWNNWGPWSPCSVSCSNGTSTRNRTCKHSTVVSTCSGKNTETKDCHLRACPGLIWILLPFAACFTLLKIKLTSNSNMGVGQNINRMLIWWIRTVITKTVNLHQANTVVSQYLILNTYRTFTSNTYWNMTHNQIKSSHMYSLVSAAKSCIFQKVWDVPCPPCDRRPWPQKPHMLVSVAQLVARRTHDRKVVGSISTNAVCFTVVR